MRVLVTGAENPVGRAMAQAIAAAGHHVRAFGTSGGPWPAGRGNVETFPGQVELGGSVEPVASECQAIVHCANLDAPGKDGRAHAIHIERGTLYVGYAAQRELVELFVCVMPWSPGRPWSEAVRRAEAHAEATRVPHTVLRADPANPDAAVQQVVQALAALRPIQHQGTASPADKPLASPT